MNGIIRKLIHRSGFNILKAPSKDFVEWNGLRLPPPQRRFCTVEWKDDDFFVTSAKREVERLIKIAGLGRGSSILDIGSGQGRLAIGLIASLPEIGAYYGIDVDTSSVEWCKNNISALYKNCHFLRIDVHNERYNPNGVRFSSPIQLPFADESFDVIFLYSVFTHMAGGDVFCYLTEIRRMLRSQGHAFFTAYAEDGVENEAEDPPGYLEELGKTSGALHRVRFNKDYVAALIDRAHLEVSAFFPRSEEVTKQSSYLITRR
jgi:SAM-dependent methyltransferase